MSDNKQNEVLTGYEQLKRRNRRRLVMASGLVAASTVLLGVALSTGPENKPEEENAQTTTIQQNNANAEPANLADATVLEPSTKEDLEAAAEAAKNADAEVADKPQETAAPEQTAQAEPQPDAPQAAPEDVGPPLVLINDTLSDSDIKGLEESEKIQKAEAAKREAAERRAEERRRNREEQRKAQQLQAQEAAEREANAAARKRALQAAKAEKAERAAAAERNKLAQLEKAEKAVAERKALKAKEEAAAKHKAAAEKAKEAVTASASEPKERIRVDASKYEKIETANKKASAVREAEAKVAKAKAEQTAKAEKTATAERSSEKAKTKTAEVKSGKKAAIQAGYAEKERALSLQRKMKAAGIDSTITEVMTDKGKVYRVKSGAYKNAYDAERDLNKLRVHGIAGQVTNE